MKPRPLSDINPTVNRISSEVKSRVFDKVYFANILVMLFTIAMVAMAYGRFDESQAITKQQIDDMKEVIEMQNVNIRVLEGKVK